MLTARIEQVQVCKGRNQQAALQSVRDHDQVTEVMHNV
jgi:hypothetical protein